MKVFLGFNVYYDMVHMRQDGPCVGTYDSKSMHAQHELGHPCQHCSKHEAALSGSDWARVRQPGTLGCLLPPQRRWSLDSHLLCCPRLHPHQGQWRGGETSRRYLHPPTGYTHSRHPSHSPSLSPLTPSFDTTVHTLSCTITGSLRAALHHLPLLTPPCTAFTTHCVREPRPAWTHTVWDRSCPPKCMVSMSGRDFGSSRGLPRSGWRELNWQPRLPGKCGG